MSDRQRALFFSILIMAAISGAVAVIVISLLYRTALEEQRTRLSEVTLSQARLLEAMVASGLDSATVMRILRHTHESYKKPGHTGVLSLARREGEHIVFLLHYGNGALALPPSLPFSANRDTPIARALTGQSGSMIGLDSRGQRVLAAYEPVAGLQWGIVAQIALREIRAPFVKAGLYAGGGALAIVLCGAGLLFSITSPLMRRLEESEARSLAFLAAVPDGVIVADAEGTIMSFNPAAERLFGYPAAEVLGQSIRLLMPTPPQSGYNGVLETVGRHQNGMIFPIDMTTSEARLGDRRLFTHMVRNTSERKHAEEALKQSYSSLEGWVAERTADLRQANRQLQKEILDRIHMEAALRSSQERLRDLAAHLQTLQEEERRRIARDIHDELGQGLAGLNMDVAWLTQHLHTTPEEQEKHLQAMATHLATLIEAVRRIGAALRPGVLDDLGLIAALEVQLQDAQRRSGLAYELIVVPEDIMPDPERATAIFRIFQAALTNVLRHADATMVTVRVVQEAAAIVLEVFDDGIGISPEQATAPTSLGLLGMQERAHLWGGDVTFEGQPGVGTTVRVRLPLETPETPPTP